jgi:DNA polymerase I
MAGGDSGKKLVFCLLHADYITEGEGRSERPLLRLWGRTREGKSVAVIDKTFEPYFYVQREASMSKADLNLLKNRIMDLDIEGRKPVRVEETGKNYLGKPVKLLKVFIGLPSDVPKFRSLLKDWRDVEAEYEYGISYYRRYMIDRGLTPMEWVDAEGSKVKDKGIAANIVFEAAKTELASGDGCPDHRILAFDIETIQESGKDKVIMVSFMDNNGFRKIIAADRKKSAGVESVGNEKNLSSSAAAGHPLPR